jgi:enoyl-CoA hydratase
MREYINILFEWDRASGVALITINRADKLNALNRSLLEELDAAFDDLAGEASARVLILTGAGNKAFVAGADIAEIASLDGRDAALEFARYGQRVFTKLERLPIPVIVAINGYALGGGCELAMCGDIRLAADTAQLGQPEINLGVIPGYGGTQRLARLVGRDRAKGLIFTGERIGAEDALRLGLVDRVLPADALMEEAVALAQTLASKAPLALALAKLAVNEGISMSLDDALEHEAQLFARAAATQDRLEGAAAFMERRQPRWTGR